MRYVFLFVIILLVAVIIKVFYIQVFSYEKLKELSDFDIPENEVPILIIGIGHLQPHFKVAVSERKDISVTNTYHQDV